MSRRDQLLKACENTDYTMLRTLGWLPILTALENWWPGRFSLTDLTAYADLVGNEPPDAVLTALRDLAATGSTKGWRPKAAQAYTAVNETAAREAQAEQSARRRAPSRRRKDQQPAALARVRWLLLEQGEHACECLPHPVEVNVDQHYILRCPHCGGIEQGQVYDAEDLQE